MTDRIRYSHLRMMAKSPAHYAAAAAGVWRLDSPAARLGVLVHGLVLGGDRAPIVYEGERRGKAWQEFQAAHEGAEIVTRAEADRAEPIAAAVRSDRVAGVLLASSDAWRERRLEWTIGGGECSGTPDYFDPATGTLIDLKTCSVASPREFGRHSWSYHYHAQLAWYRHALRTLGHEVRAAYLVAVETSAPHAVACYRLSDRLLDEGDRAWRAWWEALSVCRAADAWPGYAEAAIDLDVPEWMADASDEEVTDGDA